MRAKVLDLIICPKCQGPFELTIERGDDAHIMEGRLRCRQCQAKYDIREGIPRILDEAAIDQRNKKTAARFGHEWDAFDFIHPERYETQFLDWIAPVRKEFFVDKMVLDGGCGKGRHSIISALFGVKEVIGIDLAEGSVNAAFRNTKDFPNIHIIQANIYHLPFKGAAFDYVYCIGVLHHTPDPAQAFRCLAEKVKPGGTISTWVYGREGNGWIIYFLNPLRKYVTAKLPLSLLKIIAFILAVGLQIVLKSVYVPVNTIRVFKAFSRFLFYNEYLYSISKFPFMENYSIVFDHLLPEIAFYLKKEEVFSWFAENALYNIGITRKTKNSWRGKGEKPLNLS